MMPEGTIGNNVKLLTKEVVQLSQFNASQNIEFTFGRDGITGGAWSISFDSEVISGLDKDTTAAELQTALNGLTALTSVVVTGDMNAGFLIVFTGVDGNKDQPLIELESNTLVSGATAVIITITLEGRGYDTQGQYIEGTAVLTNIYACVQPLTGIEIQQIPNYDAKKETLKLYTKTLIATEDEIVRNTKNYEIKSVEEWYGYYKGIISEIEPSV
jgi:hypothetical protein